MTIKKATPYIFFKGNAGAAIQLYEKALGAKVESLQRYGDMPGDTPEAHKNRVMHAMLKVGEAEIMLSDLPADQPGSTGCRVEITLEFDDIDEMSRCFEALAESGRVRMHLHDAFWGDKFGTLVDSFGIEWMFAGRSPAK